MWRRAIVLAIVLPLYTALMTALMMLAVYAIVEPVEGVRAWVHVLTNPKRWEFDDPVWWMCIGVPTLIMVASQMVFLWPLRRRGIRVRPDGKPLKTMIVAAGFVGAVLTMALFLGIAAVVQYIWSVATDQFPENMPVADDALLFVWLAAGVLVIGSWIVWSIALRRFLSRKEANTRFSRVIGLLFAGTVVETLAILPIDIMIRRRTDCYCSTGSFFSLCLSAWALLWLCGPGAFLVFTRKRRGAWAETHCQMCGYVKHASATERCPECGFAWGLPKHLP